jgi:hypothetical protein
MSGDPWEMRTLPGDLFMPTTVGRLTRCTQTQGLTLQESNRTYSCDFSSSLLELGIAQSVGFVW